MNLTEGLSFIRRIRRSSSGPQVEPAINRRVPPLNRSMRSIFSPQPQFRQPGRSGCLRRLRRCRSPVLPVIFGIVVLNEDRVETFECHAPIASVGAEEDRVAAEDGRYDVAADRAAAQLGEQVDPEFVFDEDGDFGVGDVQKTAGFARCVDRQVEDVVGLIVIFTDFVARRGEKREQDFVFGMFLADFSIRGRPCSNSPREAACIQIMRAEGSMLSSCGGRVLSGRRSRVSPFGARVRPMQWPKRRVPAPNYRSTSAFVLCVFISRMQR